MRAWLELIRLPAVFTAPADVLAGLALGTAASQGTVGWPAAALLTAASVCIYAAGMVANDLFDAATDARERPGRPIPSGRVKKGAAWGFAIALQLAGAALAWLGGGPAAAVALAGTVLCTYAYNAGGKNLLVGPLLMGLCRYGNAGIGMAAAVQGMPPALVAAVPLGTLLYVAAVTGVSRHEAAGTVSPGLRASLVLMPLLALHPLAWAAAGALPSLLGGLVSVGAPLQLAGPVLGAFDGGAGRVRRAVMAGIFGIPLVNAALAAAVGAWEVAAAIVGLALLGKLTARRFYAT